MAIFYRLSLEWENRWLPGCIPPQGIRMEDSLRLVHLMMMNTIGMSILAETMIQASRFIYLKHPSKNGVTAQCYAFIQGTGLDILLGSYGLDYDPEYLRSGFNYYLCRQKHES